MSQAIWTRSGVYLLACSVAASIQFRLWATNQKKIALGKPWPLHSVVIALRCWAFRYLWGQICAKTLAPRETKFKRLLSSIIRLPKYPQGDLHGKNLVEWIPVSGGVKGVSSREMWIRVWQGLQSHMAVLGLLFDFCCDIVSALL
jgi:hypothetical protein